MNVGDIGAELEAVDFANSRFQEAVEGPCMEDYASDEEAYERLSDALCQLRDAAIRALNRLPSVAASSPLPAPIGALDHELRERFVNTFIELAHRQQALDPAAAKVLCDNLWTLYGDTDPITSPLPAGQTDEGPQR